MIEISAVLLSFVLAALAVMAERLIQSKRRAVPCARRIGRDWSAVYLEKGSVDLILSRSVAHR